MKNPVGFWFARFTVAVFAAGSIALIVYAWIQNSPFMALGLVSLMTSLIVGIGVFYSDESRMYPVNESKSEVERHAA